MVYEEIKINVGSRTFNGLMGLTSVAVFATSVTNCMVYAKNTTSSASGHESNGVTSNCSTLMLSLNVMLCVISFLAMLYFFYNVIFSFDITQDIVDRAREKASRARPVGLNSPRASPSTITSPPAYTDLPSYGEPPAYRSGSSL